MTDGYNTVAISRPFVRSAKMSMADQFIHVDGASTSVLTLQSCIEFGRPFRGPLYPLKSHVRFEGAARSFMGARPPQPPP